MRKTEPNPIEQNQEKITQLCESTGRWWELSYFVATIKPTSLHLQYDRDLDRQLKTFKR